MARTTSLRFSLLFLGLCLVLTALMNSQDVNAYAVTCETFKILYTYNPRRCANECKAKHGDNNVVHTRTHSSVFFLWRECDCCYKIYRFSERSVSQ
ncbi:hypothetical protein MKW94_025690 [Papaver nudicaule]|uniref:Uncharacterized protein n=1 Tax=Papaver nudicaule TaxID=74823 RepID=A0AA41VC61_PAPNU|nr:hypothetical protein [Papaver nudicaule]